MKKYTKDQLIEMHKQHFDNPKVEEMHVTEDGHAFHTNALTHMGNHKRLNNVKSFIITRAEVTSGKANPNEESERLEKEIAELLPLIEVAKSKVTEETDKRSKEYKDLVALTAKHQELTEELNKIK